MIYKKCSWHGCTKIIGETEVYCKYHIEKVDAENKKRYREYDNRRRSDEEQKKYHYFYSSKEWINLSESIKRHFLGMCVVCWLRGYEDIDCTTTHHIEELRKRFDLRLDEDNLIPLCSSCHQKVHKEYNLGYNEEAKMKKVLYEAINKFNKKYYT